jgi:hypothetical protein
MKKEWRVRVVSPGSQFNGKVGKIVGWSNWDMPMVKLDGVSGEIEFRRSELRRAIPPPSPASSNG